MSTFREADPSAARALALARHVTLAGLVLCALVIAHFLAAPSPLPTLVTVIGLLAAFQVLVLMRLRSSMPDGRFEPLGHLAVDLAALWAFFYASGGATNPFVDLFLVPLAAAALVLARLELALAMIATLGAYLTLVKWHMPLPPPAEGATGFQCFGMWLKYGLLGGFVVFLVHRLASRAREGEARLARAEQKNAADDYLARAGSLALGAAHEIRAPLCTLDVLVNDMLERGADGAFAKSLRLAARQLEGCRRVLGQILAYGREGSGAAPPVPIDRFLHDAVETWRLLRPNARLSCRRSGPRPAPGVPEGSGLGHVLLNLLNNAADASPQAVALDCRWTSSSLVVRVLDRGAGVPAALRAELGARAVASPGGGAGVGLLLAKRLAERAGGTLELAARPEGGTCAELIVPLAAGESAGETVGGEVPFEIRYYGSPGGA